MNFQTADIVMIKVNDFTAWYRRVLAKLIQFFDGVYYHHGGHVSNGRLYEADIRVIQSDPDERLAGDNIIVLRLRKPLTETERYLYEQISREAVGRKYDFWGTLFHQLVYILTFRRIWIGKTGHAAQKKPYCTELAVEAIHEIRGYFPQPWKLGPSGLLKTAALYYDVVFEGTYHPTEERKAA